MSAGRVCVVGASNIDLISYVPRLPQPGETLHGSTFEMGYGGKGANQGAMAAKLGSHVAMVTKLGRDVFGEGTLENFRGLGIDTTHVHLTSEAFSGVAPIAVDPQGRNAIIIAPSPKGLATCEVTVRLIHRELQKLGAPLDLVRHLDPKGQALAGERHLVVPGELVGQLAQPPGGRPARGGGGRRGGGGWPPPPPPHGAVDQDVVVSTGSTIGRRVLGCAFHVKQFGCE
jgi:hypothetical protein